MTIKLPKNISINKHTIELVKGKQLPYGSIYALSLVELETLKTYIKIHLKTEFIWQSKSSTDALILLNKKLNGSLHLYVDYQGLNNLTIKNQYSLLLIRKSLDRLDCAKQFL